jgi:hypothetical protein
MLEPYCLWLARILSWRSSLRTRRRAVFETVQVSEQVDRLTDRPTPFCPSRGHDAQPDLSPPRCRVCFPNARSSRGFGGSACRPAISGAANASSSGAVRPSMQADAKMARSVMEEVQQFCAEVPPWSSRVVKPWAGSFAMVALPFPSLPFPSLWSRMGPHLSTMLSGET